MQEIWNELVPYMKHGGETGRAGTEAALLREIETLREKRRIDTAGFLTKSPVAYHDGHGRLGCVKKTRPGHLEQISASGGSSSCMNYG
jgi:hypothetical protein